MTTNINPPTDAQSRRRRRIIIAISSVAALLIGAGVVVALSSSTPQMTAKQSLTEYIARMDDTARRAGGEWWFDSEDAADRKPWVAGTYPGFVSGRCGDGKQGTDRYAYNLYGAGKANPDKATAFMTQHWVKLGYTVRTVYRSGPKLGYGTQIVVDLPDGAAVGYTVSTGGSHSDGNSACLPSALFPQPK